jgi:hypothetical protein
VPLHRPLVRMAATPIGMWPVASDGGIFAFNIPFEGSLGGQGANDVLGMTPTTLPRSGIFLNTPC